MEDKVGIRARHVAADGECASDLAVQAAQRLFESGACEPAQIDFLLLCTQSPDYFMPTTACLLQHRLGLRTSSGALDFNLGCSGYVYGLGLAKGLVETEQARNVLLLTAETYSKYIHPDDRSVRTLFGDAAAATLISAVDGQAPGDRPWIGPFVYGTDGSGANHLIVRAGGMRQPRDAGAHRDANLYMNGPEILAFTLGAVSRTVCELLEKADCRLEDVDLFVFHQANKQMLESLRRKCGIPEERFVVHLRDVGNTVSCTIPIALNEAARTGQLKSGQLVMLVGFGVGLSWGATLFRVP